MKHLSDLTCEWLAFILNLIELGCDWPKDVCSAKAAYLSKDTNDLTDPLKYRVVLILPTLYRKWASTRLKDMKDWVRT